MRLNKKLMALGLSSLLMVTGCSSMDFFGKSEDPPLPGERVSVLELQSQLEPNNASQQAQAFVPPKVWENAFWPQRGGYPNHAMQNPAFTNNAFKEAWSVSVGRGASRTMPLTSQPIVVGTNIYTLDTALEVRAFNIQSGAQVWSKSIKPPQEDEVAIGGGLSFGEGMIYATNGFAEIAALDPNSGQLKWRKTLPSPARSAPTILDKTIYVQVSDNQLLALESASGQEKWRYTGFQSESGLVGASSPAASKNMVVAAFSSGEITGVNPNDGGVLWSDTLAPRRRVGGISSVADITGLPVLDRDLAIGIGFGNRMVAISTENGRRVWQRDMGSLETPWVAGNSVFVITTENKLVSLVRESGAINWVFDLTNINKDKNEFWTGPVFAGGRLILASSDAQIAEISAQNGELIRTSKAKGPVKVAPIIAGNTLYVLSDNGRLTAYR